MECPFHLKKSAKFIQASTMTMNCADNHPINAFAIEENLIEKLRLYSEQSLIGKLFVNKCGVMTLFTIVSL